MTKRLMPTRENLRRVHNGAAINEEDIAGVEMMLYPEFPSRFRFYTESEPLPTSLISVSCS